MAAEASSIQQQQEQQPGLLMATATVPSLNNSSPSLLRAESSFPGRAVQAVGWLLKAPPGFNA